MSLDPAALPPEVLTFVTERHLATLATLRPDGSPHVTPVGFTWDPDSGLVRIITFAGSSKVRHITRSGGPNVSRLGEPPPAAARSDRVAVCQVDGGRWLTFEGRAQVTHDPGRIAEAVRRYAARYRTPGDRPDRVAIEVTVDRVLGRA
ncbi:MAG: pyridoxamine 5'-phosphate oxidase family protein [Acidimicrobiales bacterium]